MTFWKDDQNDTRDHLDDDMMLSIQNASLIVAFVGDAYLESQNCTSEITYAETLRKEILIVRLQKDLVLFGRGPISLIASAKQNVRVLMQFKKFKVVSRLITTTMKAITS